MRNWYLSNLDITQYSSKINTIDVSKSAPQKNTEPTDNTNRAFAASLNFRLACWQPCDELLIFNELDVDPKPSDDQCQLLANILRSVGCLASSLPRADLIDWPVEKDGIQDKSDARKMMSAYIDTRTGKTSVLLMGKIAFELFSSTEKTYADTLGGTMKIKGAVNAFVVKSLQEILKDPSAKLEVWEAIQSLVKTN